MLRTCASGGACSSTFLAPAQREAAHMLIWMRLACWSPGLDIGHRWLA